MDLATLHLVIRRVARDGLAGAQLDVDAARWPSAAQGEAVNAWWQRLQRTGGQVGALTPLLYGAEQWWV